MKKNLILNRGISTIEILVVVAVIIIALSSLLGVVTYSLKISNSIKETTLANLLAQETMEAVRNFRDGTDWDNDGLGTLALAVDYYSQKTADIPPKWTLIGGQEIIDGFVRKVIFERVSRDGNDSIETTYNPANDDPDTRKVTASVLWQDKQIVLITYLTNWK